MSIVASIRSQFVPIRREGYPFIGAFAVAALIGFWLFEPLGWLLVVGTAWCVYFFRDPPRVTPLAPGLVISPADGRISQIVAAVPPEELGLGPEPRTRISVFMSVFDCHVNRSPVAGRIVRTAYRPGKFLNADLDKASEHNERSGLVIETDGAVLGVVQIAGFVARRIVSFVRDGQSLDVGERFGLIRFGSRVDVYLPEGASVLVAVGQTAIAGETVLADLASARGPTAFRLA